MKLNQLLSNVQFQKNFSGNPNIEHLTCNSKNVTPNSLFACLKGTNVDGHMFVQQALKLKAAAILVEKNLNLQNQILVKNSHLAYAQICANFFNNPAKKLKLIGVTGTNGKTTTTHLIKKLLEQQQKNVGLMGTIHNKIKTKIIESATTTPTHFEFQKLLKNMVEENCEFAVMEVSSHALHQHRTGNSIFEIGIFLNLSQDHLDYHVNMQNYFKAKKMLFQNCKKSIICIDDENGCELAQQLKNQNKNVMTFSTNNSNADFYATNIKLNSNSVSYNFHGFNNLNELVIFHTPGMFSVQNSMAALVCCLNLNLNQKELFKSIKNCTPIKGRNELIKINQPFTVICDYAHSPGGLLNILNSIKTYCKGNLIVVFGCGGDRDKTKRPIMGEIAAKNSNFVVITSDNPRTENPVVIVDEISKGLINLNTPFVKIVNRKQAIEFALKKAKKNDVVLIAGKGHEPYQIIGTKKLPFNEPEIVKQIASSLPEFEN